MDALCPADGSCFEHDTLPDAASHTRLLEILDDNYSKTIKIRCRMTTWPVDTMPAYHAISYTWGDPESNTTILVNDKTFRVRTNCEFVLKQAHGYKKSCYYWIDAVCIDQGNLEEKSKQVAMMGKIYRSANHVLACVGDHADDSLFFYQEMAWVAVAYENARRFQNMFGIICRRRGIFKARRFVHAAIHFAKRPYFNRLWIVQELRNAKEASFLCGPDLVPKEDIWGMYLDLNSTVFAPISKPLSIIVPFLWRLRAIFYPHATAEHQRSTRKIISNLTFITVNSDLAEMGRVLLGVLYLQCTHNRDKLYGVSSIFDWDDIVPPVPDYTKSDLDVALDFVQPMCDVLRRQDGLLEPSGVCHNIAYLLDLDHQSEGVLDAFEARRGIPDPIDAGLRLPIDTSSTQMRSVAKGWRVTSEHFISRNPSFSLWKFPGNTKSTACLPHWVEAGNWILQIYPEYRYYFGLLVLGQLSDDFASPIIGQGSLVPSDSTGSADSKFHIYWDPEDLLLCTIIDGPGFSDEDLVKTGVCKRQTPGSSYAIRVVGFA